MLTIFLLFQLIAGKPVEVDAFMEREQCDGAKAALVVRVAQARAAGAPVPDGLSFACQPITVAVGSS